jgi:hypothetical protein
MKVFCFFFLDFHSFTQSRFYKINIFFKVFKNLAGNGAGFLVFLKHDFGVFDQGNIS